MKKDKPISVGRITLEVAKGNDFYCIQQSGDDFWLSSEGEGMSLPAVDLFEFLDEYFKVNFNE